MGVKKAIKGISENDLRLIQRLKARPKLHRRVESLLGFVEGDDIRLADDAEENVTNELRKMGGELLEEWAQDQAKKRTEEILDTREDVKRCSKKNFVGTRHTEK